MKKVLIIVGPTASGKTSLSLEIAKKEHVEIVSADSRQIYKYLTLGTAKPTDYELRQAPHHFIDIYSPEREYNAGEYGRDARKVIDQLFEAKKFPLVVGGSGFYIKALVEGFSPSLERNDLIRDSLEKRFEKEGAKSLYKQLQYVDPESAESIHMNNRQRLIRALEVYLITGKKASEIRKKKAEPANFIPVYVGLNWERAKLYERINQRVLWMFDEGLVPEVAILKRKGFDEKLNSLQTVGYKEVFQYFDGHLTYDELITLIQRNSRHYAKRQMTWFQNSVNTKWFDIDSDTNLSDLSDEILTYFDNFEPEN
jgi:tRNA dimethylallyltransferase